MTFRISSRTIGGAAALLSLGASLAVAQDTTRARSTRRIPISKEAPGEVVRVDTVTVYRTDTLNTTTMRVDTLRLTNTQYRVDTVTKYPAPMRLAGGFYFGLGGGVSTPAGALYTPNSAGGSAQAQLGWQGAKQILGARFDVNYTQPGEDSRFSAFQADPDILNYNLDLKLQLPWFTHTMGATHRFALYGIGGYTHTSFKNLPMRVDNPTDPNVPLFIQGTGSWTQENGWNAGGGASLSWGRTELFVESRVIAFNASNAPMARQIPIVLGLNLY
ncbi:MAG: hypothetical protein ACREPM_11430 [Gemmatimonadaceae bacterium]